VTFETEGATFEGYLALPTEEGQYPGLIIVHEAFGPGDHYRDLAHRFAAQGYAALALNLYSRIGAPDPDDIGQVVAKMFELDDVQTSRDLAATAAYLRSRSESTGRIGVIGFSSGARASLIFACTTDGADALVDCYGGFLTKATFEAAVTGARPAQPMDLLEGLRCPLLAVFGSEDTDPSPAEAEEMRQRLASVDQPVEIRVFENAGHSFFADHRETYSEAAAHELWPVILDFLGRHLTS